MSGYFKEHDIFRFEYSIRNRKSCLNEYLINQLTYYKKGKRPKKSLLGTYLKTCYRGEENSCQTKKDRNFGITTCKSFG